HCIFFISGPPHPLDLHSFPTRRSSDLGVVPGREDTPAFEIPEEVEQCIRRRLGLVDPPSVSAGFCETRERVDQSGVISCVREVRSEEHTSELQSRGHLVCRLLLEKKKQ